MLFLLSINEETNELLEPSLNTHPRSQHENGPVHLYIKGAADVVRTAIQSD